MKTFNKTDLPDEIEYNGKKFTLNKEISWARDRNDTDLKIIQNTLKLEKRQAILVKVLSKNLRHKLDIHNKPYQPTEWIFTT